MEPGMNNLSPRSKNSNRPKVPPPVFPKSFITKNRNHRKTTKASVNQITSNINHSTRVLQGLESLQTKDLFCDATLVVDDCRFKVHQAVLAASSKYFWELLAKSKSQPPTSLNIVKDEHTEITLEGIQADVMKILIRFMYTGSVCTEEVGVRLLRKVFQSGRELEIDGMVRSCMDFLRGNVDMDNCITVYLIAKEGGLDELKSAAEVFIMENFPRVMISNGFLELRVEDLLALVNSENLKLKCRIALHSAAQKWLDHDSQRTEYAQEVKGQVLQTPMRIVLRDVTHNSDSTNNIESPCNNDNLNDKSTVKVQGESEHNISNSWVTRTYPTQPMILAFGGEDKQGLPSERVYQLHPLSGCVEPFHDMPIRRLDLALTPLDGQVFIAGGQYSSDSRASDSIGTVHCFDPQTESWRQMHPMLKRRALFTLDTIEKRIYAVGGKNAQGSLASVECFKPSLNEWAYTSPLGIPTFGHASTVQDGKLYITGGVVIGKHFTNTLQCYDPALDIWSYRCPMNTKRALHSMCAVGDKLYVLGGNTRNAKGKRVDCEIVECYNFETDQWVNVKPMPRAVCLAGAAVVGHCIYVIGGYNGHHALRHGDIQCYDATKDHWTRIGQLPEPLMRLSVCTLSQPIKGNTGRPSANQRQLSDGISESSSDGFLA
ncbi:kelch-like protein 13 [Asterias rubens]|uniref:kelch-like protein 13 n=1 Tax=Asterias rubens TaxID=7604 RepID=UPI001455BC08|nr:kelch-like protein 13 [Asterias rubens]